MMPLSRNKRIMLDDTDIGLNCLFVLTSVDELISLRFLIPIMQTISKKFY